MEIKNAIGEIKYSVEGLKKWMKSHKALSRKTEKENMREK